MNSLHDSSTRRTRCTSQSSTTRSSVNLLSKVSTTEFSRIGVWTNISFSKDLEKINNQWESNSPSYHIIGQPVEQQRLSFSFGISFIFPSSSQCSSASSTMLRSMRVCGFTSNLKSSFRPRSGDGSMEVFRNLINCGRFTRRGSTFSGTCWAGVKEERPESGSVRPGSTLTR